MFSGLFFRPARTILHIAFVLILCGFPAHANDEKSARPTPPERVFGAQTFTLKNGMQVVVIENHRAPVVTHMLWIRAGAADESESVSGAAHFLEHLMFKGTPTQPPGSYSRLVAQWGGNENAFTSQDYTAYFVTIAPEFLPRVMALERDRFLHLAPPKGDIASEKQVIIEERRQRTENDPLGPLYEQINAILYASHGYDNPVIGWMNDMQRLSWEDVKAFKNRFYKPENMILVVSGDVSVDQIRTLASTYYGDWPRGEKEAPRQRLSPPLQPAQTTLRFTEARIRQPEVMLAWRVPGTRQNPRQSLILQVMQNALDGGAATRLYQSLVVHNKKATTINLSYDGDTWDDAALWMIATPTAQTSLDQLQSALLAELDRAAKDLTEEEVRAAITRMQRQAVFARDSVTGPAMIVGQALATGSTLDDVETWPSQIASVTAADIRKTITYLLRCTPGPACQPPLVAMIELPPGVKPDPNAAPVSAPNVNGAHQ